MSTVFEVDERDVLLAVLCGLAVRAEDGIYDLTEKGDKWLREWCREQIEKAQS